MHLGVGRPRNETRERRARESLARDDERESSQQAGQLRGEGNPKEAHGEGPDPRQNETPLGETPGETPDEPALHHHPHQPHVDPKDRDLPIRTPYLGAAIALLGRERERPVQNREGQRHEEEDSEETCRPRRRQSFAHRARREGVAEARGP